MHEVKGGIGKAYVTARGRAFGELTPERIVGIGGRGAQGAVEACYVPKPIVGLGGYAVFRVGDRGIEAAVVVGEGLFLAEGIGLGFDLILRGVGIVGGLAEGVSHTRRKVHAVVEDLLYEHVLAVLLLDDVAVFVVSGSEDMATGVGDRGPTPQRVVAVGDGMIEGVLHGFWAVQRIVGIGRDAV